MSIMFASIGEPNAIKKSGIAHNFFSKCAIKRGIHEKNLDESTHDEIFISNEKPFGRFLGVTVK
jgi:hypothetical protein